MTDQELLNKLFQKVLEASPEREIGEVFGYRIFKGYLEEWRDNEWYYCSPEKFIFDHRVAKTIWGEEHVDNEIDGTCGYPAWQYHRRQMVLLDNPMRYFEKFLKSKGDE
jgi:hypothetical protein